MSGCGCGASAPRRRRTTVDPVLRKFIKKWLIRKSSPPRPLNNRRRVIRR